MPKQRQNPDAPRKQGDADADIEGEGMSHDRGHIDDESIEGDRVGMAAPDTDEEPDAELEPDAARTDEQRDEEEDLEREERQGDLP
jgi:hypothetical protein